MPVRRLALTGIIDPGYNIDPLQKDKAPRGFTSRR